ncbi:transposase [Photobacterium sp. S4TG1]|uniref:transposase n=1 Tax=Photobacterium sp. S4TG1 TaxID=3114587 RepID=UPI002E194238|nr:transposase [Photobacterium sp. S4TG1]
MTVSRRKLIEPQITPYYHIINRCVRRAYLCGDDPYSGKNYQHRRGWIVNKIKQLSEVFCIDVCAYAVMNNHYHLVLKIDIQQQQALSPQEVISRWLQLFNGHPIAVDFVNNGDVDIDKKQALSTLVAEWQLRLGSISWFMRCLNEEIARKANKEDECTGAFWEGRFKSQALLDEQALLSCMMYVDLNPIRAGLTTSLQDSDFTSIQQRIVEYNQTAIIKKTASNSSSVKHSKIGLLPFIGAEHQAKQIGIQFAFADYLELIDWTGRNIREDKKGLIPMNQPKLLQQMGVNAEAWLDNSDDFMEHYTNASGKWLRMCAFQQYFGGRWCKGKIASQKLHPN